MHVNLDLISDSENSVRSDKSVEVFGDKHTIRIIMKDPDRRIEFNTLDLLRAISFISDAFLGLAATSKKDL